MSKTNYEKKALKYLEKAINPEQLTPMVEIAKVYAILHLAEVNQNLVQVTEEIKKIQNHNRIYG